MPEENQEALEEEIRPERIIPEEEEETPLEDRSGRIRPILEHLQVEGATIDQDALGTHFNQLWQYERGDSLEEDEQYLVTVALFIYTVHIALAEQNINTLRSRESIINALTAWRMPEIDKQMEAEKKSDNPFKAFVDRAAENIEEPFPWKHFMPNVKKSDEKAFDFKLTKCWYAQFFIRYARVDFIETACQFDKIPVEARQDYVNLKLTNTFAKLGTFCQFKHSPAKS